MNFLKKWLNRNETAGLVTNRDTHVQGNRFSKAYNGVNLDKECLDYIHSNPGIDSVSRWLIVALFARDVLQDPILSDHTYNRVFNMLRDFKEEDAEIMYALINTDTTDPEVYPKGTRIAVNQLTEVFK